MNMYPGRSDFVLSFQSFQVCPCEMPFGSIWFIRQHLRRGTVMRTHATDCRHQNEEWSAYSKDRTIKHDQTQSYHFRITTKFDRGHVNFAV